MGACMSTEGKAEKERSLAIDKQIEEDSRKFRKECKILLLGRDPSLLPQTLVVLTCCFRMQVPESLGRARSSNR